MQRLLLLSSGLGYLKDFIGADPSGLKLLFIPTAGNLDTDVWWIDKDRVVLKSMGFQFTELDIANASKNLIEESLKDIDIVYIAGGNTFYLLKQLRDSGFDSLLTDFVTKGGLYAGASAGALVAGADIGPIVSIDEPEKVEGLTSTRGLGLVDIVPVPHYDMAERTGKIDKIKQQFGNDYELVLLTDDQAILVEGEKWSVVDSKRSEQELALFPEA